MGCDLLSQQLSSKPHRRLYLSSIPHILLHTTYYYYDYILHTTICFDTHLLYTRPHTTIHHYMCPVVCTSSTPPLLLHLCPPTTCLLVEVSIFFFVSNFSFFESGGGLSQGTAVNDAIGIVWHAERGIHVVACRLRARYVCNIWDAGCAVPE
jgi:hypothetical protein